MAAQFQIIALRSAERPKPKLTHSISLENDSKTDRQGSLNIDQPLSNGRRTRTKRMSNLFLTPYRHPFGNYGVGDTDHSEQLNKIDSGRLAAWLVFIFFLVGVTGILIYLSELSRQEQTKPITSITNLNTTNNPG